MTAISPVKIRRTTKRTRRAGLIFFLLLLSGSVFAATAPPAVSGSSKAARISLFPSFRGAVPVLVYHRLADGRGAYSVAPAAFTAQLQWLHQAGFETITLERYVAFMRGKKVALPRRPILITFDDGYVAAWEHADRVLAHYGWSAAMYVPTGAVGRPGHLSWGQLRQMEDSGRWHVDEHAGEGHVLVPVNAAGRRGPFYANELWENGRQEPFRQYKQRVTGDIERGAALLDGQLPATSHDTFAVPYGNYGQYRSNDARIEPWLIEYLKAHFAVTFVQRDHSFTRPGQRFANRIPVGSRCDTTTLEMRLLDGIKRLKRQR